MIEALKTTGTFPPLARQNHQLRMNAVKNLLLKEGAASVLDLGCGDGAFIEIIQGEQVVKRITGIDDDEHRLMQAEKRLSPIPRL